MSNFEKTYVWDPCKELMSQENDSNYAVVILNTPINFSFNPQFTINLWNNAKVRVTVDGGTKRWLHWLSDNQFEFDSVTMPDLITGDMDSLSIDVLNFFENSSTNIIRTPDQNDTDFTKALNQLNIYCQKQNIVLGMVFVLADTSGRFDHIIGNINTLIKSKDIIENTPIYQLACDSLTWVLPEGSHEVIIPAHLREHQEWCALIPMGGPCQITTTGLKWNLDNRILQFGGMISTSNTYDGSPIVTVETDKEIIWSMGIEGLI